MYAVLRKILPLVFGALTVCWAADVPLPRLLPTTVSEVSHPSYYWQATPVANTAQLLTLFCRECEPKSAGQGDQPLVAVLRDTLGDKQPENDRVTDVWLLTYSHLNFAQRALSAMPFFYWRVGQGSRSVSARDTAPLFDLTAPQRPVLSEAGRDILQWSMLDPMTTPVRASSRAYRTNQLDHERLHLEEAISYLRQAPVSNGDSSLTQTQIDTVMARLELRKRLLGGLVDSNRVAKLGAESGFEQERIRSRNWELLRQCAEKTGLFFEPLNFGDSSEEYAILWFPLDTAAVPTGTALAPIWKLLNIRNPWSDPRLENWRGPVYLRSLDDNPAGQARFVPLAVYSLSYPKLPLLLVDFRDKLHVRWHEMTQRSINEITAGVIGISHFTNWYYYAAADLYDFVATRHGAAMNQAARLDAYSQFRVALALDRQLDPALRQEMQRRVDSLALNPLEAAPAREFAAARARYARLQAECGENGKLAARLDKQRRYELAYFAESKKAKITEDILHHATLGLYTHRARKTPANLETLDADRRVENRLQLLDSLAAAGTEPEVAYDASRIHAAVAELTALLPAIRSSDVRAHAAATLLRLKDLSGDERLRADCLSALVVLKRNSIGIAAAPHSVAVEEWKNAEFAK